MVVRDAPKGIPTTQPVRVAALAAGGFILHDAFDGSGALSAHAIAPVNRIGASWGNDAAYIALSGGYAALSSATPRLTLVSGVATGVISARFRLAAASDVNATFSLYFRSAADAATCLVLQCGFGTGSFGDLRLYEFPGAVQRAMAAFDFVRDTWYEVAVYNRPNEIVAAVDDDEKFAYASAAAVANAHAGMRLASAGVDQTMQADWFKAEAL